MAGTALARLPSAEVWRAVAQRFAEFFDSLDAGARIGLLARSDPARLLVWEATIAGMQVRLEPFSSYTATAADIVLAADDEALVAINAALGGPLFDVLRANVRAGHVVCYMLRRRCVLEERGFEEMLEALGFVFMGACR